MNESQRVVVVSMDWTEEAKYWVGEFFEGLPDEWLKGEDVFDDIGGPE
jgi:hypothetical protein